MLVMIVLVPMSPIPNPLQVKIEFQKIMDRGGGITPNEAAGEAIKNVTRIFRNIGKGGGSSSSA